MGLLQKKNKKRVAFEQPVEMSLFVNLLWQCSLLIATVWYWARPKVTDIQLRALDYTPEFVTPALSVYRMKFRGIFPFWRIYFPPYSTQNEHPTIKARVHGTHVKLYRTPSPTTDFIQAETSTKSFDCVLSATVKDAYGNYQDITKIFLALAGPK